MLEPSLVPWRGSGNPYFPLAATPKRLGSRLPHSAKVDLCWLQAGGLGQAVRYYHPVLWTDLGTRPKHSQEDRPLLGGSVQDTGAHHPPNQSRGKPAAAEVTSPPHASGLKRKWDLEAMSGDLTQRHDLAHSPQEAGGPDPPPPDR